MSAPTENAPPKGSRPIESPDASGPELTGPELTGLEIEADRAFQERWWRVERVGWVLMALLVVVAAIGLTGGGGSLSRAQLDASGATIDYPRIGRWQSPEVVTISIPSAAPGLVDVLLPGNFLEVYTVESVSPQPYSVMSTPDGQVFTFELGGSTREIEGGTNTVLFALRAARPSLPASGRVRVGTARPVELDFVVLP